MRRTATITAALLVTMLAGCEPEANRDAAGAIVSDGDLSAFEMKVGDCFDDSQATLDGDDTVSEVLARPCSEPHDNEVFAVFDLTIAEFPGEDEITELATELCLERFADFVNLDYPSSTLALFPITPTEQSWLIQKDREVICALFDMDTAKLTGTMRNSGI
jgi:hypothetical protein